MGANNQPGLDAVYPYLYDSSNLEPRNLGFIMVQVKNDPNAAGLINETFRKMDPFSCGLIDNSDKVDGRFPIPIIRLVFLLAENQANVIQQTYESPSHGARTLQDEKPLFTSYDYVCSGVSTKYLRPIDGSDEAWKALINRWNDWGSFYDVVAPGVLRSQLPGHGSHSEHFSSWSA